MGFDYVIFRPQTAKSDSPPSLLLNGKGVSVLRKVTAVPNSSTPSFA